MEILKSMQISPVIHMASLTVKSYIPQMPELRKHTPPLYVSLGQGFETLSKNNNPITASERNILTERLTEAYMEVDRLGVIIRASVGQAAIVAELEEQQRLLIDAIETHKKILAPIRKVTCYREIVKMIFRYLPQNRDTFHPNTDIFNIMRLCKDYYIIAILDCQLWRTFNIRYQDLWQPALDKRLRKHIFRANRQLLSICIIQHECNPLNFMLDPWISQPGFRTLMRCADRWYSVDLPVTTNTRLPNLAGKLKNLRYATLGSQLEITPEDDNIAPWQPQDRLDILKECGLLQEIHLQHHVPLSHLTLPQDPRFQTRFRGPGHPLRVFKSRERITKKGLASIFWTFPNIEEVVVDFSKLTYGVDKEGTPIKIPNSPLKKLALKQMEGLGPDNLTVLRTMGRFNNLEHLQIPLSQEMGPDIATVVGKQAPNLKSLQFRIFPSIDTACEKLTPQTIFDIVIKATGITKLTVEERWGAVDYLPTLFTLLSQSPQYLTHLEDIHLSSSTPATHRALFAFVQDRLKTALENSDLAKMRKVTLLLQETARGSIQRDLYEKLRMLREVHGVTSRVMMEGMDPVSRADMDWEVMKF